MKDFLNEIKTILFACYFLERFQEAGLYNVSELGFTDPRSYTLDC